MKKELPQRQEAATEQSQTKQPKAETTPVTSRRSFLKLFLGGAGVIAGGGTIAEFVNKGNLTEQLKSQLDKAIHIITKDRGHIHPFTLDTSDAATKRFITGTETRDIFRKKLQTLSSLKPPRANREQPPFTEAEVTTKMDFRSIHNEYGQVTIEAQQLRTYHLEPQLNSIPQLVLSLDEFGKPINHEKTRASFIPIISLVEKTVNGETISDWSTNPYWPTVGFIYEESIPLHTLTSGPDNLVLPNLQWSPPEGYQTTTDYFQTNPNVLNLHNDYWWSSNTRIDQTPTEFFLPLTAQELINEGLSIEEAEKQSGKIYFCAQIEELKFDINSKPLPTLGDKTLRHIECTVIDRQIIPAHQENVIHEISGRLRDQYGQLLYAVVSCYPLYASPDEATHRIIHWMTAKYVNPPSSQQ